MDVRRYWLDTLLRVATPVLEAASEARLKRDMPVEHGTGQTVDRRHVSHLEALARTLAGIAPWLELDGEMDDRERGLHARHVALARAALHNVVMPGGEDRLDLHLPGDRQPLVESAMLAHALLRAPDALWHGLDAATRGHLLAALRRSRAVTPFGNNWLLFPAMIDTCLHALAGDAMPDVAAQAVARHSQWYLGDGVYGDGPGLRCDYYNSFVIQPMLLDIVDAAVAHGGDSREEAASVLARAQRHAETLERMIAPGGTFPPLGRSLAYRCGAFHLLAQLALQHRLPASLPPAQVRSALSAVIHRTLDVEGTFDAGGWLAIGLAGHQPMIAESYISTGSLYLCTSAFLPLGLPADDPFWSAPPRAWTSRRAFSSRPFPVDVSLRY